MEHSHSERRDELLVQRAVEGLDPAESAELDDLLARLGHDDPEVYDLAAASVWLAAGAPDEPMPEAVAERARRTLEAGEPAPRTDAGVATPGDSTVVPLQDQPRPARPRAWGGWVAAAAALVLAVAGWWPRLDDPAGPARLTAERDALLAEAPDAVRVDWSNTDHPRAQKLSGGYVVWSDERQRGYMTFRDLPDNDPDRHQYQLWVFDSARSADYPVDGGVFDAQRNADGEIVIRIENKLPVRGAATLFAVTLEPPGGVVVSDRDPILWVAKPDAGTT